MEHGLRELPLDALHAHPANPNAMSAGAMAKLSRHIEATGCYPPLIVRPRTGDGDSGQYELLDGHQRAAVLRKLGHTTAWCVVWDVDDGQALMLLATLNRLRGDDDPRLRGQLLRDLAQRLGEQQLLAGLPESRPQLEGLLRLPIDPPRPCEPVDPQRMPTAVHFFLLQAQRHVLDQRLRELGGTREEALMRMVEA